MHALYVTGMVFSLLFGTLVPIAQAKTEPVATASIDILPLGESIDVSGRKVQGYKIVHYKEGRLSSTRNPALNRDASCYGFMARGAKWKGSPEPWLINPTNPSNIDGAIVTSTFQNGVAKWEDAADGALGSGAGKDIIGNGTPTAGTLVADEVQPDGFNEVLFGQVDPGAIAVTIVWGYFGGLSSQRQLLEWDQVYSTNYAWSTTGEAGKMDLDNIATHELGHTFGLADLYKSSCGQQTMYGYATFGEINKRSLEIGDVTGITALYK